MTCSQTCRRQRQRLYNTTYVKRDERRPSRALREPRVCECGTAFISSSARQLLCGQQACQLERNRQLEYGLTRVELRALRAVTHCEMCGHSFDLKYRKVIDHDHDTGLVRGVLCDGCNVGLGHVERVGEIALAYLARHRREEP